MFHFVFAAFVTISVLSYGLGVESTLGSYEISSQVRRLGLAHTDSFETVKAKLQSSHGLSKQTIGQCYDYKLDDVDNGNMIEVDIFGESVEDIATKLLVSSYDFFVQSS